MGQPGFFDLDKRLEAISAKGAPLEALNALVPFESFRVEIEAVVRPAPEERKSKRRLYLPLARIAVNIPDGQMPHFIQPIRSFAAARHFQLVLGGYSKFSRSPTNLEIYVGRDSYLYGSNFFGCEQFRIDSTLSRGRLGGATSVERANSQYIFAIWRKSA